MKGRSDHRDSEASNWAKSQPFMQNLKHQNHKNLLGLFRNATETRANGDKRFEEYITYRDRKENCDGKTAEEVAALRNDIPDSKTDSSFCSIF